MRASLSRRTGVKTFAETLAPPQFLIHQPKVAAKAAKAQAQVEAAKAAKAAAKVAKAAAAKAAKAANPRSFAELMEHSFGGEYTPAQVLIGSHPT